MSHIGRDEIEEFGGIAKNVHRAKLPSKLFQTDAGGDRYELGSWRVRRGRRRTDVAKKTAAIDLLHGFELPDGSFGLLVVYGTTADGETNVAQQADS
jgi:hypothetical protein